MKKIQFAFLALVALFIASCSEKNEDIMVRFHNTLSDDITDARMEFSDNHITDIGLIPAGGTTDYVLFDYFEVGDHLPMGALFGKKGDADFIARSGLFCATGVEFKQLEPGYYQIDVVEFPNIDTTNWHQYYIKLAD